MVASNFDNLAFLTLKTRYFAVGIISLNSLFAQGQDATSPKNTPDSSVVSATNPHILIDPELLRYTTMMDSIDAVQVKTFGYRIQIYSGSGPEAKQIALKQQSDFLKLYSDHSAYTNWDYPNWVVRLGDYRNHLEALEFHDEIKAIFPASFIVKDQINTN